MTSFNIQMFILISAILALLTAAIVYKFFLKRIKIADMEEEARAAAEESRRKHAEAQAESIKTAQEIAKKREDLRMKNADEKSEDQAPTPRHISPRCKTADTADSTGATENSLPDDEAEGAHTDEVSVDCGSADEQSEVQAPPRRIRPRRKPDAAADSAEVTANSLPDGNAADNPADIMPIDGDKEEIHEENNYRTH